VNEEVGAVWGITTFTTTATTVSLSTSLSEALRPDAVYFNAKRIPYKSQIELDYLKREWRGVTAGTPIAYYQPDYDTLTFYPPPTGTNTLIFEYPKSLSFATDTSTHSLPAWTKYSGVNYTCFRALLRHGQRESRDHAIRYKSRFLRDVMRFREIMSAYLPEKFLSLRPGGHYEKDILEPSANITGITMPGPITRSVIKDEIPGGTINGSNLIFTLTSNPNPDISLKLFKDGVLQVQGTHYTLSITTITFISPYQPVTGQDLFASYQYGS